MSASSAPRDRSSLRRELGVGWLHLAVLWTLAFAQPLFDVLADAPDFFVARGNTRADILVFAFGLVFVPPTLLIAVEAAAVAVPRLRRALHLCFVAVLVGAFALQLADEAVGGGSAFLLAAAALVAGVATTAYARSPSVSSFLTVLSPAPLLFLGLFLLGSPVSKLVLPQGKIDAATADIRSHPPVVLLVLDEFDSTMLMDGRERIDRTRYPSFASFADGATWYRNAVTVNGSTTQAVPAILSGLRSRPGKLPIATDYPNNLFTLLGGDYSLYVRETATELCPERLCGERERDPFPTRLRSLTEDLGIVSLHFLLPKGLRSGLPAVDRTFGDFAGGGGDPTRGGSADVPASSFRNRRGQFDAFLRGIARDRGGPSLHFLHVVLPHTPWEYLPTGQQYVNNGPDAPGLEDEHWVRDSFPALLGLQRHLLQVGYTDRLVGRMMTVLRRRGLYDRALVAVVADHGVSYRPGQPRRGLTQTNASDIAAVPLLIKYPHQRRGRIDDSMVETIQVVPTIARELGAKLPWDADGPPIGSGRPSGLIRIAGPQGEGEFRLPFVDFLRERKAGLRRLIGLLGADDGGFGLYANSGGADLIGHRLSELGGAPPTHARVELDSGDLIDHFKRGSRVVPSFVSGRIEGDLRPGTPLAIAVNGRIAGTTRAFRDGGEVRMAGIVPSRVFRDGANALEVGAIQGVRGRRLFAALDLALPETYRLVEEDGRTRIVGAGQEIGVGKRLQGSVELAEVNDQGLRVAGWAIDPVAHRPVERVLAFQGDRLVGQGSPRLDRPDIVRHFRGPSYRRSGFDLRSVGAGVDLDEVHVFAVSRGAATELQRLGR